MKLNKFVYSIAMPVIMICAGLIASSCRSMVTPEQLEELRELRAKEKSLTEQIQRPKDDISSIKTEINTRESELKECQEKSDFVGQKLSQWPNVWPDSKPEQQNSPVETSGATKSRK